MLAPLRYTYWQTLQLRLPRLRHVNRDASGCRRVLPKFTMVRNKTKTFAPYKNNAPPIDSFGRPILPVVVRSNTEERPKESHVDTSSGTVEVTAVSSNPVSIEPSNEKPKQIEEESNIENDDGDDFVMSQRRGKKNSEDKAKNDKSNEWQSKSEKYESKGYNDKKMGKSNKKDFNKSGKNSEYKKKDKKNDDRDMKREYKLNFQEIDGDLFSAPKEFSLAHCVGEDMTMNAGIAVDFRKIFKKHGFLLDQNKQTGDVAILEDEGRFIYYLVTKKLSTGKPTLKSLQSSLEQMRVHVDKSGVKNLAMPMIGCGLDRLNWDEVKSSIMDIFGDLDMNIVVYNYIKVEDPIKQNNRRGAYIKYNKFTITDLNPVNTVYVYIASLSSNISRETKLLDRKFRFLNTSITKSETLGDIIKANTKLANVFGLLCRDRNNEISFNALEKCLFTMNKHCRLLNGYYIGLELEKEIVQDEVMLKKFEAVFKFSVSPTVEVNFCSLDVPEMNMPRSRSPNKRY